MLHIRFHPIAINQRPAHADRIRESQYCIMTSIMKILLRTLRWTLISLALHAALTPGAVAGPGPCVVDPLLGNPIYIEMKTTAGSIEIELWPDVAPCTINNFFAYIDSGRYDGTFIHRSVDGFVIQGGGYAYDSGTGTFASIPVDPAVVNEPSQSNLAGTIAMARVGGQVNSATSQFFINLADNTGLDTVDEGFTVFGEVVPEDMPVVNAIGALPRLVGRWSLNTALREVFGDLPVHNLPTEPPGGYGCFDPDATPAGGLSGWVRALVDVTGTALEPDPLAGNVYYLSNTCTGSGAQGPPSVPCTTDRTVAYSNGAWYLDPTPMTCDRIAESEESLAARRDDQHPQVGANLVEVSTILLPEPVSSLMLVSGLCGLYGLGKLRSRGTK
jgi:cyclophilin family peptidyl-prolyl cis-trans isomerase